MLFAYSHGFDKCQHTTLSEKLHFIRTNAKGSLTLGENKKNS
jgi:hypothetical protein